MSKRITGLTSLFLFVIPLTLAGCNNNSDTTSPSDGPSTGDQTAEITVVNGTGGGTYNIGDIATITATIPSDKLFDYWAVGDLKVSENNPYSFKVKESATYTAFFKDEVVPVDPDEVLSNILVVSDVHISAGDQNTKDHLKNTLNYALDNNIDAIIFNGDTPNIGKEEDYTALDGVFTEIFETPKSDGLPELIFNMGNHEFYPTENCAHEETNYDREVGKFKAFANKWGQAIEDNVFVREVEGIKCVIAFPSADRNFILEQDNAYAHAGDTIYLTAAGAYSENDVNKVKQKFDAILSDNSYDKPIIFCTHHPLGQTYGSTLYGMDAESEAAFKTMLSDYPMVVHLAGHTHFSNLHERSISQGDFTSIQIGTHTYGKYVSGVDYDENNKLLTYDNITGKRYNSNDTAAQNYHGQTNFGILLSFTRVKMIANRINLSSGQVYSHGNWEVPFGITKENKDSKFSYKSGDRTGEGLSFDENSEINATITGGKLVSLTFEDVNEYWACEGYEISILNSSNTTVKRVLWSSHFWMGLNEKQIYTIPFSNLGNPTIGSGYSVKIRAINFFGRYSDAITQELEGQGTPVDPDEDTLPGHEGALLINNTSQGFDSTYGGIQAVNDWYNSGKSFYFEVKKMLNGALQSGTTLSFSLCGKNLNRPAVGGAEPEGDWNRLTAMYVLEFQDNGVLVYRQNDGSKTNVATVTNLGDRWFGVKIPYNSFELNSGEYAMGNENETFTLCYMKDITRSFKIDNINSLNV